MGGSTPTCSMIVLRKASSTSSSRCQASKVLFTADTMWTEGSLGFWVEHTRTLWSSQIWFDLLLRVYISWLCMAPHAHALGMHLPEWTVLVVGTGNMASWPFQRTCFGCSSTATARPELHHLITPPKHTKTASDHTPLTHGKDENGASPNGTKPAISFV